MSQGLGITKQPLSCSFQNAARFSARVGMARPLFRGLGVNLRGYGDDNVNPIVRAFPRCRMAAAAPRTAARAGATRPSLLGRAAMPSFADQAANRRKFLQFLAASPVL